MKTKNKSLFFRITGRIDNVLTQRFKDFCSKIPEDYSGNIFFLISSKGGYLLEASKIIELRNKIKTRVVTIGYEMVNSAAITIFASGDIRLTKTPRCKFLFHEPRVEDEDFKVSEEDLERSKDSVYEYLAGKTKVDFNYIKKLSINNVYIDAVKAKELGLVHKILKNKTLRVA